MHPPLDLESWVATRGLRREEPSLPETAIGAALEAMVPVEAECAEMSSTAEVNGALGGPLRALLAILLQRPVRFRLNRLVALACQVALDPLSVRGTTAVAGAEPSKREAPLWVDAKSRIHRRRSPGDIARIGAAYIAGGRRWALLPFLNDADCPRQSLRSLPVGAVVNRREDRSWIGSIGHARIRDRGDEHACASAIG